MPQVLLYAKVMPNLFQTLRTCISGNTHNENSQQERMPLSTLSPIMLYEISEAKEITLTIDFDYSDARNNDSILMSVDLNVMCVNDTQAINIHTEFKPQDLVAHEFLYVINTAVDCFIALCTDGIHNLTKAVQKLSISHNLRGYTHDCTPAYKLKANLMAKVYAKHMHNEHELRLLYVLNKERHYIRAVYPHTNRDTLLYFGEL